MFKVYAERSDLLLEDCRAGAGPWLHLSANASAGGVDIEQLEAGAAQPSQDAATVPIHAVYGVYTLLSGPYLAVVTDSRVVGSGPNSEKIYCVLELTLLPVSAAAHQSFFRHANTREKQDEREYCRMLKLALASRTFYFSYDLDLTLSAQKRASASSSSAAQRQSPLYARAEEDFFWNKPVMGKFIELELGDWIIPVISGFVKVIKKCDINGQRCDILFFTRRSWKRVGTRFNVRGVDKDGCVANFAETEMLLVKPSRAMCSYVQVRGSIPLYWDQMVTLKYMPRTRYAFSGHDSVVDWNELAFRAHMDDLIQRYGHITCVNLIDKAGKSATVRDQAQLGSAFGKYVKKYNQLSKSGDGTSSAGSSAVPPMPAAPAFHAMSPRQHKSMSVSLPSAPVSNGANGFVPSNGGGSAVGSPTSASPVSNSDKGSGSSSTPSLQSSVSLPVRDQSQLSIAVPSAPTSISQLFADPVAYEWFDFHHECRNLAWHNLSKLMTEVGEQFTQYRWFECDGEGRLLSRQRGVFRVNCMDNLDRTNVVMSLFARRTVLMSLQLYPLNTAGIDKGNGVLDSPYNGFEVVFKNAWADNADYVSRMYAGTGALKTDFTRTGRRTIAGALQDGVNSVTRYYLNNFSDGIRQDSFDLLVGNFTPDKRDESPFTFQQQHSLLNMVLEAALATLAVISVSLSIRPELPVTTRVRDGVIAALALFSVTGYLIITKGKFRSIGRRYVCKPAFSSSGYIRRKSA
ncbi:Phosphatidylinositide phosphatase SAC1 [Phytophthora megakarya]|uniref:Phosphatidylinositide phosphatase SAC1 n=1 Tax=Phytophthora megakarya TaxID=4795 RepID=A0A225VIE3_9STRA|nr:Phosphatidylinositide phosphatase SAC1 [Phytophthora megakarya]